jgi:hypothetical protein
LVSEAATLALALHPSLSLLAQLGRELVCAADPLAPAAGVFTSTADLEAAIRAYIEQTNAAPKPFVWTKPADAVLASVGRFCQRISNSDH